MNVLVFFHSFHTHLSKISLPPPKHFTSTGLFCRKSGSDFRGGVHIAPERLWSVEQSSIWTLSNLFLFPSFQTKTQGRLFRTEVCFVASRWWDWDQTCRCGEVDDSPSLRARLKELVSGRTQHGQNTNALKVLWAEIAPTQSIIGLDNSDNWR